MMQEVILSIIIPVYNQFHYTKQLVESLQHILSSPARPPTEIILFDDASTDDTSIYMAYLPPPHEFYKICSPKNKSVTNARNTAISKAQGEYVLVLNNDITITKSIIEEMMSLLENNPDALIANAREERAGHIFYGDRDNISGACWMIRRQDWKDIGPIPIQLKLVYNDDYIYKRVTQTLKKKSLRTNGHIFHYTSQTLLRVPNLSEQSQADEEAFKQLCKNNNRTDERFD